MRNMLQANVALIVPKRVETKGEWQHCFVANALVDHVAVSLKTIDSVLPLYVFPGEGDAGLAESLVASDDSRRTPSLNPAVVAGIGSSLGCHVMPEQILAYTYAVLYSPTYRARYAEFLKTDFPRIPFAKDRDTFLRLADLGQQLIDLHLMRSTELDNPISRFCGKGDGAVIKVEYDVDSKRVSINPTQYFDGVTPDLWSYQIGGYQVLAKWLKDRKGRFLTSADTIHYSRIVTALAGTTVVQGQIDAIIALLASDVLQRFGRNLAGGAK
jgi:predicted helicase